MSREFYNWQTSAFFQLFLIIPALRACFREISCAASGNRKCIVTYRVTRSTTFKLFIAIRNGQSRNVEVQEASCFSLLANIFKKNAFGSYVTKKILAGTLIVSIL